MRRFLIPLATIGLVAAAQPALAQGYDTGRGQGYGYDQGYDYNRGNAWGRAYRPGDMQRLSIRIEQLVRSGRLDTRQAANLRYQARNFTDIERRYAVGGYSRGELSYLTQRYQVLQDQLRAASRGYDRDDRWQDRDGRWQDRDGRWQDRDGRWQDRDGRWRQGDDRYDDDRYDDRRRDDRDDDWR